MYFITGASGLLGSHLLMQLLEQGKQVKALYRSEQSKHRTSEILSLYGHEKSLLLEKVTWVKGDINDIGTLEDALENVDYVFHCAAMVSFKKTEADQVRKINVEGTANLVNCSLSKGIKKFCYASSIAAIGQAKKGELTRENDQWAKTKYTSNYGISKHQAEMEVWRGQEEGLAVVMVNPGIILGPGVWEQSSASLFQKVWDGLAYYTKGSTGFVAVQDVAKSMDLLMQSKIVGKRFILSAENWSYERLFNAIAIALKKPPPHIEVKKHLLSVVWRLEALRTKLTGGNPLITRETAHSSVAIKKYDGTAICKAIEFQYTPLNEVIEQTGKYFLQQYSQG